jgi:putative transposase
MEGLRIPEILYTDNGSEFTSRHLEQVSADLKVRLVFSTPGVPRGRVERFFSSIDQMFLCTLPGFKCSGGKRRLTLAEFDVLFRKFILETYNERPHGETGVAPVQRWETVDFCLECPRRLNNSTSCCSPYRRRGRFTQMEFDFRGCVPLLANRASSSANRLS